MILLLKYFGLWVLALSTQSQNPAYGVMLHRLQLAMPQTPIAVNALTQV